MNIEYTDNFLKEAKQLSKKFKLLKEDLQELIQDITINKDFGTDLGSNVYKKRVKNSSIPTGKVVVLELLYIIKWKIILY